MASDADRPRPILSPTEIDRFFEVLTLRQRYLLACRFGLDRGTYRTIKETADELGVTPAAVRRAESAAFDRYRRLRPPQPGTDASREAATTPDDERSDHAPSPPRKSSANTSRRRQRR